MISHQMDSCVYYGTLLLLPFFFLGTYASTDTISLNHSLTDGQTLTSNGGDFQLGFFTPTGAPPAHRYVGIWYNRPGLPVVIWVANGEAPINGTSGVLTLNSTGALVLVDGSRATIWSTATRSVGSLNLRALLNDSGNLVVQQPGGQTLWQSFDEPSNMLVPASAIYVDLKNNKKRGLVSWKSISDPSPGTFSHYLRVDSFVQGFTYRNGSSIHWRSGPWVGSRFAGIPEMRSSYAGGFSLNRDGDGVSIGYAPSGETRVLRLVLGATGKLESWRWDESRKEWLDEWSMPQDDCDAYGKCGEFAVCNLDWLPSSSSSMCSCLRGFRPRNGEEWRKGNWTSGCLREKELACVREGGGEQQKEEEGDGFVKLERMKVPDFAESVEDLVNWTRERCEEGCRRNCSCLAYAFVEGNCMVWGTGLVDMKVFASGGDDLYIKLEASELDHKNNRTKTAIVITVILVAILGFLFGLLLYFFRKKVAKEEETREIRVRTSMSAPMLEGPQVPPSVYDAGLLDFTFFSFNDIVAATNDFSKENKLGEGGFGSVYKGVLRGGHEVAVKRMPGDFGQGLEDFRNEVMLISKLQHRNLVRLLGCCFSEEKLLIYEFMPNKSLDAFLFAPRDHSSLDWSKRFRIIEGVAQGLLYLHRDSRLKIIHRDLKASNILLDGDLNAKIADFGTARIFYGDQILAKTGRVVGTCGYMPPEYALHGQFSEKSDVFSFGVLVLEILSGKRIGIFYHEEYSLNLIGYAWRLWRERNVLEFIDPHLSKCWPESNAMKCILVGLLCVQEVSVDRPTMSQVVSMLTSDTDELQAPKMPSFIGRRDLLQPTSSQNVGRPFSINQITLTRLEGR